MSKGYLLIAHNNQHNDYVKQAIYCAQRIKMFCNNASVSIITSNLGYLKKLSGADVFEHVIDSKVKDNNNYKLSFDGALSNKTVKWINAGRDLAYDLSPYDETILLDTDYIISNSNLNKCFDSINDFMLFRNSKYIGSVEVTDEFFRCSDSSIDFYWATVIYFKKSTKSKTLFDTVQHIRNNWVYYNSLYQINSVNFRNDYAFSIALHMLNDTVATLPGKMYYIKDQDFLEKINNDKMIFLVGKKDHLGEYTLLSTEGLNVHVLNKSSLERIIE